MQLLGCFVCNDGGDGARRHRAAGGTRSLLAKAKAPPGWGMWTSIAPLLLLRKTSAIRSITSLQHPPYCRELVLYQGSGTAMLA